MSDFMAKMHQIHFPDPTGGAYSTLSEPLTVFKRPTFKGKDGEGKDKGKGKER